MNPNSIVLIGLIMVLALLAVAGIFGAATIYRRYTGVTYFQAVLLWLLAICVSLISLDEQGTISLWRYGSFQPRFSDSDDSPILHMTGLILLCLLAVPFSVKLYRKIIGGHLTDSEKLTGYAGVRAWLGGGNFICAILIPLCAWQGLHLSPLSMCVLTFGLLLGYPLINTAMTSPEPAPLTEDLSSEREKVLQLLEAGKITAEESAELLNALGHSSSPRSGPVSTAEFSRQRKLILLGVGLLLIGFFLPWFVIDTNVAANALLSQIQQTAGPAMTMPQMMINTTVQVRGGDLAHGTGWWILVLGIVAAGLPFFATTLNAQMQKRVILAALCIGAFLLIYLVSESYRYVGVGIILAAVGYALEIVGTLKEQPGLR